jgi:nicotinamidase-related amidase
VGWTRPRFEIARGNTALLVIDMQRDFIAPGAPYECASGREMIEKLNELIAACREAELPIVFTAQMHHPDGSDLGTVQHLHPLTATGEALREGTPGVELYPEIDARPTDRLIHKRRYSAFFGTDLDLLLRSLGVEVLIVGGVATNVCCDSTIRDAFFRNYKPIVLSDGNATLGLPDTGWGELTAEQVHAATLSTVSVFFGEVASVADVVERVRAATPAPAGPPVHV